MASTLMPLARILSARSSRVLGQAPAHLLGVGDDLAGVQILDPAGGLHSSKETMKSASPLSMMGRIDLVAEPDIGDHAAAPLAHAVDLGDLHVIPGVHQQVAQHLGGQQGALGPPRLRS